MRSWDRRDIAREEEEEREGQEENINLDEALREARDGPQPGQLSWGPPASWKPGKASKRNSGWGEAQGPCFWSLPELLYDTLSGVSKKKKKKVLFHKKRKTLAELFELSRLSP